MAASRSLANAFGLTFHHLGLAVAHQETARAFLEGMGYALGDAVTDTLQNVTLALCTHPTMPDVELVTPASTPCHLDKVLEHNPQGTLYHFCYTTQNLDETLDAIEDAGHRLYCIAPPKPAVLFQLEEVSFYIVEGFGLIEIIDQQQK